MIHYNIFKITMVIGMVLNWFITHIIDDRLKFSISLTIGFIFEQEEEINICSIYLNNAIFNSYKQFIKRLSTIFFYKQINIFIEISFISVLKSSFVSLNSENYFISKIMITGIMRIHTNSSRQNIKCPQLKC